MKFPDVFEYPEWMVMYLTGNFPFSYELQAFWMAFQGAMAVRAGPNKDRSMHWFHAFMLTVFTGYAGASFTPIWMGMPTSMLSNDLNLGACAIAYFLVNCTPFDLGYKLGRTLPVTIITTMFSQLFRSLGIVKFTTVAYEAFKASPSKYYPIPVFGPIAYGTILGNMGGFFSKGFTGYLENGMPWPFQNGLFCGTLYHFFVHDEKGPIGIALRKVLHSMPWIIGALDDERFAVAAVGAFMQIVGLLQIPHFLGPGFSPFNSLLALFEQLFQRIPRPEVDIVPNEAPKARFATESVSVPRLQADIDSQPPPTESVTSSVDGQASAPYKRRRRRSKKKEL